MTPWFYQMTLALWLLGSAGAALAQQNFFVTLQYHHVDDATPASTSVSIAQFESHLDYLQSNGFTVVALDAALGAVRNGEPLPDLSVAITFDDSYRSIYDNAYPRLRERGWPFTVFINTAPIEQGQPWALSWQQLSEMQRNGALIGNHSVSHPHFPRQRERKGDAWAEAEIQQAGAAIEAALGQRPTLFAWPYGEYGRSDEALLKDLGLTGFGQHAGVVSEWENPRALPRFAVNARYGDLATLADKLRARPMPVTAVEPGSFVLPADKTRPLMTASLEHDAPPGGWQSSLQCFISGQGRVTPDWLGKQQFQLQAPQPLSPGRNRYTCTARASDGRYHWFSRQWLLPRADGSWPAE